MPLSARQEKFVLLILEGKTTQAEAYVQAGYKAKTPDVARINAARLIASDNIGARLRELREKTAVKVRENLAIETTDVARLLWSLANYDLAEVFRPVLVGRGRNARTQLVLRPPDELPKWWGKVAQGVRIKPDGTAELIWPDRQRSGTKVGEHLGMFQGETADLSGRLPTGDTNIQINDNRTMVYVDKPRDESVDEWRARIAKERGIGQVEHKGTNGTGAGNGSGAKGPNGR